MKYKHKKSSLPGSPSKKVIYYDGLCTMCSTIVRKVGASSKKRSFIARDLNSNILPTSIKRSEAKHELHVINAYGKVLKNADAIYTILDEYPKYRLLSKVGRLPIIKQMLQLFYKFIASNRKFVFGLNNRIFWLKLVLGAGFLSGILISFKLWTSSRPYPLTPIYHAIHIPSYLGGILLILLIGELVRTLVSSKPSTPIFMAISIIVLLIFADQSRLQPWVVQYSFMLLALGFFSWRASDKKGASQALNVCRLIVIFTYLYSGLQKFNAVFILKVFPWMIDPLVRHLPAGLHLFSQSLGAFIPIAEVVIGVSLLSKKTRNFGVVLAICMHLSILLFIGPLGRNWNSVVWPWNIAMILFDVILFWNVRNVSFKDIIWDKRRYFQQIALLVFGILPILSFFNLWDSYLSSALYSGNINDGNIYLSTAVKDKLPPTFNNLIHTDNQGKQFINVSDWSLSQLNVPAYPETRIFKNTATYICFFDLSHTTNLQIVSRSSLIRPSLTQSYSCDEL